MHRSWLLLALGQAAVAILTGSPAHARQDAALSKVHGAPVAPAGMLRFSFGPIVFKGLEGQPSFREGFAAVNVTTDFSKVRGFGWVGAEGQVANEWLQTRGKLGSRARRGPNDLLAGWIGGGLPFTVTVPPGKYIVTTCLGDWGEYEFFPFGSYTLLYQGEQVLKSDHNKSNLGEWILKHKYDDFERGERLFDRYVKTRFDLATKEVDAAAGAITIQARVDAGPAECTGTINYVVITPIAERDAHLKYLADLEEAMRADFDKRFPMAEVRESYADSANDDDKQKGFCLFRKPWQAIYPWTPSSRADRLTELHTYATLGQFEAVDFGVIPLRPVGSLACTCSDLAGPNGARIPTSSVTVGYVKYWDYYDQDVSPRVVRPEPYLVMDRNTIPKTETHTTRQWWITVHVPETAAAGTYRGTVTVKAEQGGGTTQVPLVLDVIPLKLDGPVAAMLLNYAFPWDALYYGDENARWADIEKELASQRDHGMNSAATGCHLPVKDNDTSEWERLLDLYRKVGMDEPLYFAGTMNLYGQFGNLLDPAQQEAYCGVFRKLDAVARRKGQKVIYSVCDEGTNDGFEARSALAARILRERAPDIQTIGDINGYRELMSCAPFLHAAGFNNGWHGAYGTNRQDHDLMTRTVSDRVKALGCDPWFVNGGVGRYPFGLFFWKMQSLGLKGKCEWMYYATTSDPYNPFDGNQLNAFGSLAFPGCIPTLHLEHSREGIDDLRYVRTLQRVVGEMAGKKDLLTAARVQVAREALDYWLDQVPDRMAAPRTSDGAVANAGADFPPERLAAFRQEMAWHLCRLLKLDCPSVCPSETMIASWEPDERTGWTSDIESVSEHATHGTRSGKMVFGKQHTYYDTWGGMRPKDWRGYRSFRFDISNPQPRPIDLVLTIRDQLAANIGGQISARKTLTFHLKPGPNPLMAPLVGITDDSGKRALDLSCVFNAFFTVKGAPEGSTLFVDNMRVVQDE